MPNTTRTLLTGLALGALFAFTVGAVLELATGKSLLAFAGRTQPAITSNTITPPNDELTDKGGNTVPPARTQDNNISSPPHTPSSIDPKQNSVKSNASALLQDLNKLTLQVIGLLNQGNSILSKYRLLLSHQSHFNSPSKQDVATYLEVITLNQSTLKKNTPSEFCRLLPEGIYTMHAIGNPKHIKLMLNDAATELKYVFPDNESAVFSITNNLIYLTMSSGDSNLLRNNSIGLIEIRRNGNPLYRILPYHPINLSTYGELLKEPEKPKEGASDRESEKYKIAKQEYDKINEHYWQWSFKLDPGRINNDNENMKIIMGNHAAFRIGDNQSSPVKFFCSGKSFCESMTFGDNNTLPDAELRLEQLQLTIKVKKGIVPTRLIIPGVDKPNSPPAPSCQVLYIDIYRSIAINNIIDRNQVVPLMTFRSNSYKKEPSAP